MPSLALAPILNVSFYRFVELRDLENLRDEVKARAIEAGLKGSILLSEEGINGFLAGTEATLRPYLAWLYAKEPFRGIQPKESFSATVPFSRMLVKIKKEIITMGRPEIRPARSTGKRLTPAELKQWYESEKDFVIVDTRNTYEIAEGTFRNAVHYDIETFKEFPEKLEKEAKQLQDKPVVMFCTGGIRCEKATALAMELGVKDVYQLEGGILKYFEDVGQAHYKGDCFVFDHRSNVDSGLEARRDRTVREKMESLTLHYREGDAQSERVRLALAEKKIRYRAVSVGANAEAPVLVQAKGKDDPLKIPSAEIIYRYLEDLFPERSALKDSDAERKARERLWWKWTDDTFGPDAEAWMKERSNVALEAKLEKHLYRVKTPLQRKRRFLVLDRPTGADFAVYSVLKSLRASGFPTEYPERFEEVWTWFGRIADFES